MNQESKNSFEPPVPAVPPDGIPNNSEIPVAGVGHEDISSASESANGTAFRNSGILRGAVALTAAVSSMVGITTEASPGSSHHPAAISVEAPKSLTTESPTIPKTETKVFTVDDSERYAREFSVDPEAGILTQSEAPQANATDIANQLSGEKIQSISIQGSASAEDSGPEAGVTTPSEQNSELAAKRANVFLPQLEAALSQAGVSAPEIQTATPIEDSWSAEEVSQASALATQFGYQDYPQMIEAYNNAPNDVPPDVESFLDQTLQSHRDVRVVVVVDENNVSHAISVGNHSREDRSHIPGPGGIKHGATIDRTEGYIPDQVQESGTGTAPTSVLPNRRERRHGRELGLITHSGSTPTVQPPTFRSPRIGKGFDRSSPKDPSQRVGGSYQGKTHKQPLPQNYTPGRIGSPRNKGKSLNRRGSGRGR